MARFMFFSKEPSIPTFPGSFPPCPGSMTIIFLLSLLNTGIFFIICLLTIPPAATTHTPNKTIQLFFNKFIHISKKYLSAICMQFILNYDMYSKGILTLASYNLLYCIFLYRIPDTFLFHSGFPKSYSCHFP